jgi:hypothetical protein
MEWVLSLESSQHYSHMHYVTIICNGPLPMAHSARHMQHVPLQVTVLR